MTEAVLFVALALLAGLLLGWFLGGRNAAAMRGERDRHAADFKQAIVDLASAQERVRGHEGIATELALTRDERDAARTDRAKLAAHAEAFEARLAEFRAAREEMSGQFRELSDRMLKETQASFLARAHERFEQHGEATDAKMKALLDPVQTTLKRYEEHLGRVEKEREGSYRELKESVAQLTSHSAGVVRETQRLANVMRSSPKARGRWGEEQLKNILTAAGLAENVDFTLQTTVNDEGRNLRPDCIVNLPGERCIVIDVKCPLVHFEQAFDEEDEARRADLLLAHANAMKSYANDLGRKGYWRQFERSPDFVILYVPGEHFLSAAAERAPDLIESAFRNGVVIASTINMLALAKIMAGMWRQESLREQAKEIADVGKELYKRLATMSGHVAKLGRNLTLASSAYNDMVGSLESQVYTQARRFEALNVETGSKPVEGAPMVETAIRPLTKLASRVGADTEAAGMSPDTIRLLLAVFAVALAAKLITRPPGEGDGLRCLAT